MEERKSKALTVGLNPEWLTGFYVGPLREDDLPVIHYVKNVRVAIYPKALYQDRVFKACVDPDTVCRCTGEVDGNKRMVFYNDYLVDPRGILHVVEETAQGWKVVRDDGMPEKSWPLSLLKLTGANRHDPHVKNQGT